MSPPRPFLPLDEPIGTPTGNRDHPKGMSPTKDSWGTYSVPGPKVVLSQRTHFTRSSLTLFSDFLKSPVSSLPPPLGSPGDLLCPEPDVEVLSPCRKDLLLK